MEKVKMDIFGMSIFENQRDSLEKTCFLVILEHNALQDFLWIFPREHNFVSIKNSF